MPSLKSKIVIGLMRHRHLFKGKLKREAINDDLESVLKFREICEEGAKRFGKVPDNIVVKEDLINMVKSEWLIPKGAMKNKLIFYVHGGGYVSGSCNDHRAVVAKIAQRTGVTNLLYEYGVAPEDPFPTALNDSVRVYETVLDKGYQPEDIIIMGESAGGGLALALLLYLRDHDIPLPKAAVAISPWTDLSCSGESYYSKNNVSLAPANSWTVFSKYYAGNHDVKTPYISPLFGDLSGLPPVHINAGESDELFDDGRRFAKKADDAGVDVTFCGGKEMIHCYPLLDPMFPEATEAMDDIVHFIHHHLTKHDIDHKTSTNEELLNY